MLRAAVLLAVMAASASALLQCPLEVMFKDICHDSLCQCQTSKGMLDLSPLYNLPALTAEGPLHLEKYTYSPCRNFSTGGCHDVLMCQHTPVLGDTGLATPTHVTVSECLGNLVLRYRTMLVRDTHVYLTCNENTNGTLKFLGYHNLTVQKIHELELQSKYACLQKPTTPKATTVITTAKTTPLKTSPKTSPKLPPKTSPKPTTKTSPKPSPTTSKKPSPKTSPKPVKVLTTAKTTQNSTRPTTPKVTTPLKTSPKTSPKSSPKTSPKPSPKTSPKPSPKTSPKPSPKTSPKPSPKTSPKPTPKTSPKPTPKTSPKSSPKTSQKPSPKTSPKPSPKTSPIKPSPKTSPRPTIPSTTPSSCANFRFAPMLVLISSILAFAGWM